jgi:aquaporin Z
MKKIISEFICTFFLVFIGTGSVIVDAVSGGKISLAGISIITGAIVTVMIKLLGSWSGAHMNPAVTISLATGGKFFKKDVLPYILAQITGAFAASGLLKLIFSSSSTLGETLPSVNNNAACALEFILTFFLMLVILASAKMKIKQEAYIIGLYVAIGIFIGGPICGGSMNPVRSLSPAVLNNNTLGLWIYLIGPTLGAIAAVLFFKLFDKPVGMNKMIED